MKVAENQENSFKKASNIYYIRNEDNTSRYDHQRNDLKSRGFLRPDSNKKFFRTASKNNYARDDSKFGKQGLNIRQH